MFYHHVDTYVVVLVHIFVLCESPHERELTISLEHKYLFLHAEAHLVTYMHLYLPVLAHVCTGMKPKLHSAHVDTLVKGKVINYFIHVVVFAGAAWPNSDKDTPYSQCHRHCSSLKAMTHLPKYCADNLQAKGGDSMRLQ